MDLLLDIDYRADSLVQKIMLYSNRTASVSLVLSRHIFNYSSIYRMESCFSRNPRWLETTMLGKAIIHATVFLCMDSCEYNQINNIVGIAPLLTTIRS